jgi:predicted lactoylglutathione lyase
MPKTFFLNIRVENLDRTVGFFSALGFKFNPKFSNENATCMIINDACYVMFATPRFFEDFTKKHVVNAKESIEGLFAVSLDSKDEVNHVADKAVALGGVENHAPEDLGYMFSRSIEDLDGHQWDFFYMNDTFTPD